MDEAGSVVEATVIGNIYAKKAVKKDEREENHDEDKRMVSK